MTEFRTHIHGANHKAIEETSKSMKISWSKAAEILADYDNQRGNVNCFAFETLRFWNNQRRPFFNVYPAVIEMLSATRLDISPSMLRRTILDELKCIEIRLPFGLQKEHAFFLGIQEHADECHCCDSRNSMLTIRSFVDDGKLFIRNAIPWHEKIEENIDLLFLDPTNENESKTGWFSLGTDHKNLLKQFAHISVGILMLAADDRFIEPVLLQRDLKKPNHDKAKSVERAKRNGVFGFEIGKHIELSPHFRRPHFAIRWTETGRSVPRLVPVVGSVVNRQLLKDIPTGYDGKVD